MWPEGIKLGWAMPHTMGMISYITHVTTFTMDRPDFIYLEPTRGGDIAEKRENQVEVGLKLGCTHILLLDGDMVYYPTIIPDLFKVLADGADLAGGLVYRGYEPYNPLIWHPTEERQLIPFADYNFGDVVDAGATGAACLLVPRRVFEGVERPWFRIQKEERQVGGSTIILRRGEDTYFTRKATGMGYKLRIATQKDIGHLREFTIDRHFWLTFAILNEMGSWENAIKLFKRLKNKEWFEREIVQPNSEKEVGQDA